MRIRQTIVAALLLTLSANLYAQQGDSNAMSLAYDAGLNSLVAVIWEQDTGAGPSQFAGMGACILVDDDGSAVVMTVGMDPMVAPENFEDIKVILPGVDGEQLNAELMGVDQFTGLAFVRVTGSHGRQPVSFARNSDLSVGDEVVSVGLLPEEMGREPYVGRAYISASLRTPGLAYMISGGKLTNQGSLVMNAKGQVVGLVGQQMFVSYQMIMQRRPVTVPL